MSRASLLWTHQTSCRRAAFFMSAFPFLGAMLESAGAKKNAAAARELQRRLKASGFVLLVVLVVGDCGAPADRASARYSYSILIPVSLTTLPQRACSWTM